jgi:hypothetical protein
VPEKFEPYVPEKFALAGLKLTFRCYFQEGVPESTLESSRKRHLLLLYHLEDDSCEIVEPEVRNNGMIPGRFLKRMKIPDVTPDTLRVGGIVEIFSRTLRLYACDDFTAQEPGPTFAVRVRFDGLVPGTTYYYVCGSEVLNAPFSEVFSFTYASGSVREGGAVAVSE